MPEVAEVRQQGVMVGIDLGDHDAALRMGHRVTVEARERGAFVRPLGNTVVLMPPLSISARTSCASWSRSPRSRSRPRSPPRRPSCPKPPDVWRKAGL